MWLLRPARGFRAGPRPPPCYPQPATPQPYHAPSRRPSAGMGPATTSFEQRPHFRAHTGSPGLPCCRSPRTVALTCQTSRHHGFTPQSASSLTARASACRPPRRILRARRCLPRERRPPQGETPVEGAGQLMVKEGDLM